VQSVAACRKGTNKYEFKFDRVFPPEASQADVFGEISQLVQVTAAVYTVWYLAAFLYHLPRQQWSLFQCFGLHRVTTVPASRNGIRRPLLCDIFDEIQMVPYIVDFCPLMKLNGGLSQLYCADDEAVA